MVFVETDENEDNEDNTPPRRQIPTEPRITPERRRAEQPRIAEAAEQQRRVTERRAAAVAAGEELSRAAAVESDQNKEYIDAFLWVTHGTNVSSVHNFYPIETKFKAVTFYSRPFEIIDSGQLEEIMGDPCRIMLGACPKIPVTDKITNKKDVFLPPLVFSLSHTDLDGIKQYAGLYKYRIIRNHRNPQYYDKSNLKNCAITKEAKLLNHSDIISKYGDGQNITYSQIFQTVLEFCKQKGKNPEEVLLGIFSCQVRAEQYIENYDESNILNLIGRNVDRKEGLIEAEIFTKIDDETNTFLSPTVTPYEQLPDGWNALANIKHQGCALNVLSYFGIIDQSDARESTVCLSILGTSIFKIVDYINTYLIKKRIINDGYMIKRHTILVGITVLYNLMTIYDNQNYCIIFKIYRDDIVKGKPSQVGHTVAFFRHNDSYWFIDPQQSIIENITEVPSVKSLVQYIQSKYPGFNFIDIIYTLRTDISKTKTQIEDSTPESHEMILERSSSIRYGGKKPVKSKKIKKSKISKKNKKNKRKTIMKRKTNKNKSKKYYGGETELDNFEKLMTDIDKKLGTPTALDIATIDDI